MKRPLLTVVMPIYNGEKCIDAAIDSILSQTFKNFELLIINDGSGDNTVKIISCYKDERIRLLDLKENKGIAYCINLGLREALGVFITWTDGTDLNLPTRFEIQLDFLQNNPDFGGCGNWLTRFKADKTFYVSKAYENPETIKAAFLFKPVTIPNATAMLRLSEIKKHDLKYDESIQIGEDYDFIFRCSRYLKFSKIQEILYMNRDSESRIIKIFKDQDLNTFNILKEVYKKTLATLDLFPSEKDLLIHHEICSRKIFSQFSKYEECFYWLENLKLANDSREVYDIKAFNYIITEQFFSLSKKASSFGLKTLFFFTEKSLKNNWKINPINYSKLAVRCALKYNKFEFKLT